MDRVPDTIQPPLFTNQFPSCSQCNPTKNPKLPQIQLEIIQRQQPLKPVLAPPSGQQGSGVVVACRCMQPNSQKKKHSQRISVHDGDALAVLDVLCSGSPRGSRPPGRSTEDGELRRVQESMQRCSRAAARCLSLQGASIRVEDDFVQSGSFAFLSFFFI